jgi:hypothetical protein
MRYLIFIIVLSTFSFLQSCRERNCHKGKNFSIKIKYSSVYEYPAIYHLTEDAMIVKGVNSKDRKEKILYKRELKVEESDSIYNFLKTLSFDTLQATYDNTSFFDGTEEVFNIQVDGLRPCKVLVYMTHSRITDTLTNLMQTLVLSKKFQKPWEWRN